MIQTRGNWHSEKRPQSINEVERDSDPSKSHRAASRSAALHYPATTREIDRAFAARLGDG